MIYILFRFEDCKGALSDVDSVKLLETLQKETLFSGNLSNEIEFRLFLTFQPLGDVRRHSCERVNRHDPDLKLILLCSLSLLSF